MRNTTTAVTMLIAAVLAVVQLAPASLDRSTVRVEFVDLPQAHMEIATWALGLYDEAGLALPATRFEYHGDDRDPCGGWLGCHEVIGEVSVIGICTSDTTSQTEALFVHELAHAWSEHSLSDQRRSEFRELRGWTVWRGGEVRWQDRGAEQAAEILTWGLIDRPTGVVSIADHGCDALDAGYRTLTGDEPLHGYHDFC